MKRTRPTDQRYLVVLNHPRGGGKPCRYIVFSKSEATQKVLNLQADPDLWGPRSYYRDFYGLAGIRPGNVNNLGASNPLSVNIRPISHQKLGYIIFATSLAF